MLTRQFYFRALLVPHLHRHFKDRAVWQKVYGHAKYLKEYMEQIDNPDLQQLLSAEIRSLVPLLKNLDAKRSMHEAEAKSKKAREAVRR